jgi:hypothetical protein
MHTTCPSQVPTGARNLLELYRVKHKRLISCSATLCFSYSGWIIGYKSILSPLQLIEPIAALVPPPRTHRRGLTGSVPALRGATSVTKDTPARPSRPGVRHAAFAHWADGRGSPQRAFACSDIGTRTACSSSLSP